MGRTPKPRHSGPGFLDVAQDDPRPLEQLFTRGQKLHAARRAGEEFDAEFGFELADAARERRLRNVQATRGARQVGLFGHGHERFELSETHGHKCNGKSRASEGGERRDTQKVLDDPGGLAVACPT
jgi:hypothetical protein